MRERATDRAHASDAFPRVDASNALLAIFDFRRPETAIACGPSARSGAVPAATALHRGTRSFARRDLLMHDI